MRKYARHIAAVEVAAVLGILFLFGGAPAFGQSLTVTRISDMNFGSMFPGVPKEIDKASADAIEFQVTGTAGAEITLDFSLPEYMAAGLYNMQVIFYQNSCAIDTSATPDQASPTFDDLDPWQTLTYRLGSSGMTVWLGCKAVPRLRQQSGSYTGDVVLTVNYTGN